MSLVKFFVLSLAAALALGASAQAADLVAKKDPAPPAPAAPAIDWAFGGKLMTDYIARGVTQSDHKPAVTAYGELRYNATDAIQLYAASLLAIKLDNPAERAYLDMLAARLGLDANLKASIEQAVANAAH